MYSLFKHREEPRKANKSQEETRIKNSLIILDIFIFYVSSLLNKNKNFLKN